jgi:hypothetical protein
MNSADNCHCGKPGVFGYQIDKAQPEKITWFCAEHRLGEWYADASAPPTTKTPRTRNEPAPDLQELVRAWGGYNKIPPDAWREFDAAMKAWRQGLRHGDFCQQKTRGRR